MTLAFNLHLKFNVVKNGKVTKVENNHMRYDGDFGNVGYADQLYDIQRVDVFSPSLHMMLGVTYPVEVQVKAKSPLGGYITLSYLYDEMGNMPDRFFADAGFVGDKIKTMTAANKEDIGNDLTLRDLVGNKRGYIFYEGTSLLDDCEPSIIFVSNEIGYITENQANQLVRLEQMKPTSARPLGLLLHQNIDSSVGTRPTPITQPLPLLRFPSSFENSVHMYFPDEKVPLGTIPSNSTPGWLVPNGTVKQVNLTAPPPEMKYLVYYYEPMGDGSFSPVFLTVPHDSRGFLQNIQPASLDVWIRADEQFTNGIRRLLKLKMGVYHTSQAHEDKAAKDKAEALRKATEEYNAKKAAIEKKIKVTLDEIDAIHKAKRTRKNIKFKRVCIEWKLENIVNRDFNQPEAWALQDIERGGHRDLLICQKWEVKMINDNGQEINEAGEVIAPPKPNEKNETEKKPTEAPHPELGKVDVKKCGNYLLTVLNQRFDNKVIKDYILDKCKDWKSKILPKAAANSFAQVGVPIHISQAEEKALKLSSSKLLHSPVELTSEELSPGNKMSP